MQKHADLSDCRSKLIAKVLFARTQSVKDELFLRKDPGKTYSTKPEGAKIGLQSFGSIHLSVL